MNKRIFVNIFVWLKKSCCANDDSGGGGMNSKSAMASPMNKKVTKATFKKNNEEN
jgi:hypothetical protein